MEQERQHQHETGQNSDDREHIDEHLGGGLQNEVYYFGICHNYPLAYFWSYLPALTVVGVGRVIGFSNSKRGRATPELGLMGV